ncbi:MAG TPA: exodeoxyribonuclease III, partial [Luteimonas sp.]|nr:exodeoxyribonuclease III [Luteimonas sp.]
IKNWTSNQKNSGCLPEERAWLDKLLAQDGWVDSYRRLNPEAEEYTWWSQRGAARAKNVGWRIDYQMVSPGLGERLKSCAIAPEPRFSDHAPFVVDFRS